MAANQPACDNALFEFGRVGFVRAGRAILADVDWRVDAGERWAVLGPNGCGKSTLLKLAIGMLWPTTGTVRRQGREHLDLPAFRRRIGWITDSVADHIPAEETARDTVLSGIFGQIGLQLFAGMSLTEMDRAAAVETLERFGCGRLADRRFGVLSQGEKRKVLVARALVARPLCLVLDEPCAGMDPGARESFLAWLGERLRQEAGPAMILVTHHLEEILPEFTHTILLREGRVLARGASNDVLSRQTLESLYQTPLDRLEHSAGRIWPIWAGG